MICEWMPRNKQHTESIPSPLPRRKSWESQGGASWAFGRPVLLRPLSGMHCGTQCGDGMGQRGHWCPRKLTPKCFPLFQFARCWHWIHLGHRPKAGQMDLCEGVSPANSRKYLSGLYTCLAGSSSLLFFLVCIEDGGVEVATRGPSQE